MNATAIIQSLTEPAHWLDTAPARWAACLGARDQALDQLTGQSAVLPAAGRRYRGVGLLGLADDTGIELNQGRPGARLGPAAFRTALQGYGSSEAIALSTASMPVIDLGDVVVGADLEQTHHNVTQLVMAVLELGLFPVSIGGGHDLTFPFVRAVIDSFNADARTDFDGIYFDAHLDVRDTLGSGMPFRALVEHGRVHSLQLFGMDPLANRREHFNWFEQHGGVLADWPAHAWPQTRAQFVSVDLDVVDMAQAPGVSAPAPAGWASTRLADYAEAAGRHPDVCCFDIMELSPPHDHDQRTARLAAHLFLRFLSGLQQRVDAARPST
ncbi:MAG: arginase family protein [Pseudomonadota bacterium]